MSGDLTPSNLETVSHVALDSDFNSRPHELDKAESDQYEYLSPDAFQQEDLSFVSNPLVDRYHYLTEDDGNLQRFLESMSSTILEKVTNMKQFMDKEREAVVTEMTTEHQQIISELQIKLQATQEELEITSTSMKQQQQYKKNFALLLSKRRRNEKQHNLLFKIFSRWRLFQKSRNENASSNIIKLMRRAKMQKIFTRWRYLNKEQQLQNLNQVWESRLKQISRELSNDYEGQLRQIRNELVVSRDTIQQLNDEKTARLNDVKSALMRGVNALNVETLALFQSDG